MGIGGLVTLTGAVSDLRTNIIHPLQFPILSPRASVGEGVGSCKDQNGKFLAEKGGCHDKIKELKF